MYKAYCRIYQLLFRCAMVFLPWRRPERISMSGLGDVLKQKDIASVLIVTDATLISIGLHKNLLSQLEQAGVKYAVYDKTTANPTIANIEEALAIYRANDCRAVIALGGGSPIDCAKGIGARAARPNKSITKMKGQLRVLKKLPTIIAIPTTAGTGSETTLAAVITDEKTHEKYAINDPVLIPLYAVLDPELTKGLPPHITASTGVDALVHAVEAYIGGSNTKQTEADALEAVKLIFDNLYNAYLDGTNMTARENMQQAAFLAGAAFTRAFVGNVHAIAHTLGGQYGTAHGLANAVIMPYVLDMYMCGARAKRRLAELHDAAGLLGGGDEARKAERFIAEIRLLNQRMNIGDKIPVLKEADIPLLAGRALKEANPLYPVPRIFSREDMEDVYRKLLAQEQ